MTTTTIGLIAAMAEEIAPLLKTAERVEKVPAGRFTSYRVQLGDSTVWLVQSGMGEHHAAAAMEQLLATATPSVIISFGFGGAVLKGLHVGDVVIGVSSWRYSQSGFQLQPGGTHPCNEAVIAALAREGSGRLTVGEIITSTQILVKNDLAGKLPGGMSAPVLDMETAALAELAHRHGLPLIALRAISDDAGEELGFSLQEFTDEELNIRPGKVLATILRKPQIIPQLIRLARNSSLAGKKLALAVRETILYLDSQAPHGGNHPLRKAGE